MAAIKSYSDLQQSKKLAGILPLESADMVYCAIHNIGQEIHHCNVPIFAYASHKDIPCWSLGALLEVLPMPTLEQDKAEDELFWQCSVYSEEGEKLCETYSSDKVDACYEMIIKLHEMNLL